MSIETRPATADDAPFLAWVIQAAARSHLELGIWDLALPGPDEPRLEFLATLALTDQIHFGHFSRFRVLEVDGVPAAGLSAYENSEHGMEKLALGLVETSRKLGWTQQKLERTIADTGSFNATGYPIVLRTGPGVDGECGAQNAPAGSEQALGEGLIMEDLSECWCCAPEGETCAPSNRSGNGRIVLAQCFKSRRGL